LKKKNDVAQFFFASFVEKEAREESGKGAGRRAKSLREFVRICQNFWGCRKGVLTECPKL
jgi:hypothetical protein